MAGSESFDQVESELVKYQRRLIPGRSAERRMGCKSPALRIFIIDRHFRQLENKVDRVSIGTGAKERAEARSSFIACR
jgi:hypothetical protein